VSTFDLDGKRARLAELEKTTAAADFWEDQKKAQSTMSAIAALKEDINACEDLVAEYGDTEVAHELALAGEDEELGREFTEALARLHRNTEGLEMATWFTGEFDARDAIVSIQPGAGGMESMDWAEMMLRMLLRYCESRGWKVDLNEVTPGQEQGIKSATFTVHGRYGYGTLLSEKGVHRLVRISPFDQASRRHTSFASVDVIPLIGDEIEVEIDPKDLRIDTYRSSSAGGQHVNVTDSAVRITHMPTGVVVSCQNERSQLKNKETAMVILRARLFERARQERKAELDAIRGEKKDIAFGSQIRSYVLQPYTMVKDHRTDVEVGNAQAVIDGALDRFVVAYHRWRVGEEQKASHSTSEKR
jgi:peptide chain release factor 2